MKPIEVSIITPSLNEELIIENFVTKAISFLRIHKISGEVIVVENGSTDDTFAKLQSFQKKYPELKAHRIKVGDKGKALIKGMESAKGKNLITVDTDLWDDNFARQSLESLRTHDIVVGSRAVGYGADERPLVSRLLNIGYNFLFKLIFNLQGTNTHAQLSFRAEKIIPLVRECKTSALNFDTELIIRAERAGLSKIEVPVVVKETRVRRYSVFKQLRATISNFFIMLRTLGPTPDWSLVLLGVALLIGGFMRFYQYPNWFFFSVDEELNSYMTRMISHQGHLPAIGGPISGTSLYMAPWFLYFNALFFLLSGGNVVFSGVVFALIELLTVVLVYFIAKRLFSPRAGALTALCYAGSLSLAIFDRHYWNITLVPFISMLTFYTLLNYISGRRKWFYIAALTVGFGMSTTFSVFAVFLFASLVILLYKKPFFKKDVLIFWTVIALFHFPLLIFELRHNFQLSWALWNFLTDFSGSNSSLITQIYSTTTLAINTFAKAVVINTPLDFSDESSICTLGVKHFTPPILSLIFALGVIIYSLRKKLALAWALVIINLLSLIFFHSDQGERHFLPSLPVFFIFLGGFLASIYQLGKYFRTATIIIVFALLVANISSLVRSHASFGITDKQRAVQFVTTQTKKGQFYLDSIGDCHKWGYQYLFSYAGHEPVGSYLDNDFAWMYKNPPHPQDAKVKVTFLSPNQNIPEPDWLRSKRTELKTNSFKSEKFGNIEVYLEKL